MLDPLGDQILRPRQAGNTLPLPKSSFFLFKKSIRGLLIRGLSLAKLLTGKRLLHEMAWL